MAGNVSKILDALEDRVNAVLPSSYKRLKYTYDLSKNDLRGSDNAYAIGADAGNTVSGVLKTSTIDQVFFLVITARFTNRTDDKNERKALAEVYDNLETCYRDIFQSKGGLGNIILVVQDFDLEAPEIIGEGVISVRCNFTIKHRKSNT